MYVVCTAGEFVWNEGCVVQLPAPYIMLCDFYVLICILVQFWQPTGELSLQISLYELSLSTFVVFRIAVPECTLFL